VVFSMSIVYSSLLLPNSAETRMYSVAVAAAVNRITRERGSPSRGAESCRVPPLESVRER
jgi:hypothetical protein